MHFCRWTREDLELMLDNVQRGQVAKDDRILAELGRGPLGRVDSRSRVLYLRANAKGYEAQSFHWIRTGFVYEAEGSHACRPCSNASKDGAPCIGRFEVGDDIVFTKRLHEPGEATVRKVKDFGSMDLSLIVVPTWFALVEPQIVCSTSQGVSVDDAERIAGFRAVICRRRDTERPGPSPTTRLHDQLVDFKSLSRGKIAAPDRKKLTGDSFWSSASQCMLPLVARLVNVSVPFIRVANSVAFCNS